MGTFMQGMQTESVYNNGQIAADFLSASSQVFLDEGHTIPVDQGENLYTQYCATCHGDQGEGNGPGNQGSASGSPAAFPTDMNEAYIFWRIWEGVPDSNMYAFQWLLEDDQVWSITLYILNNFSQGGS
jgi:mono/diheme cytochrome c family protein